MTRTRKQLPRQEWMTVECGLRKPKETAEAGHWPLLVKHVIYMACSWPHFFRIYYLFNLLKWHWFLRSYTSRFQVYISILYLYIAPCAHHLKSNHLPPPHTRCPLHPPPSTPFPLAWVSVCPWVSVFYRTKEWNHVVLSFFWPTYFT